MAGPSKLTLWQHRVREHPTLTPTERAVAFVLSTYMNKDTLKAWPSFETLAAGAGCSPQTVKRAVKRLEAEGLLWRKPGKYTGRASEYTGRWKEGVTESKRGGHSEQDRGSRVTPQHGKHGEQAGEPAASPVPGSAGLAALDPPAWHSESWAQGAEGPEQRAERAQQVRDALAKNPRGPLANLQRVTLDCLTKTPGSHLHREAMNQRSKAWQWATKNVRDATATKEEA